MAESRLFNLEKLIKFRRTMHQNAESAYEEIETSKSIIQYLKSIGVQDSQIQMKAKTGVVVDIYGKAPPSGKPFKIAYRADMDCLPMKELTDIEYKSKRDDRAHMCGHDGHCAWLLGSASKIMEKLDKIPSDKCVRLFFQPAEEAHGGAFPLIQEGCMAEIDEVYGAHNLPVLPTGKLLVKSGPVMAQITEIDIKLTGKGGHVSTPQHTRNPLLAAIEILSENRKILQKYQKEVNNKIFVCSIPYLRAGESSNVISEEAVLQGTIRSLNEKLTLEYKTLFQEMCERVCKQREIKLTLSIDTYYPVVDNWDAPTAIVTSIAKEVYGDENVSGEHLPILASEDFSYYMKSTPGTFFFPTSGKLATNFSQLHQPTYDFDDEAIENASELFYRIALHRFGVKLDT